MTIHTLKHSEKHSEINVGKPEKSKGFLWRSMVTGSGWRTDVRMSTEEG